MSSSAVTEHVGGLPSLEDRALWGPYMIHVMGPPFALRANSEKGLGGGSWPTSDFWVVLGPLVLVAP